MDITQKILAASLTLGAAWVMWLLLGLSWLSIAVVIERLVYFIRRASGASLPDALGQALRRGDLQGARALCQGRRFAHVVGAAGLLTIGRGARAVGEALMAARSRERIRAERFLVILGTLGNNAPFIGLFGTVLGIIKAFHDLGRNQSGGASAVMAGISEALVATAVGLIVAIPAVVAYNAFQRAVRAQVARSDEVAHVILTFVEEHPHEAVAAATAATAATAIRAADAPAAGPAHPREPARPE
jgi:biopolymer transport protein ExbB